MLIQRSKLIIPSSPNFYTNRVLDTKGILGIILDFDPISFNFNHRDDDNPQFATSNHLVCHKWNDVLEQCRQSIYNKTKHHYNVDCNFWLHGLDEPKPNFLTRELDIINAHISKKFFVKLNAGGQFMTQILKFFINNYFKA